MIPSEEVSGMLCLPFCHCSNQNKWRENSWRIMGQVCEHWRKYLKKICWWTKISLLLLVRKIFPIILYLITGGLGGVQLHRHMLNLSRKVMHLIRNSHIPSSSGRLVSRIKARDSCLPVQPQQTGSCVWVMNSGMSSLQKAVVSLDWVDQDPKRECQGYRPFYEA